MAFAKLKSSFPMLLDAYRVRSIGGVVGADEPTGGQPPLSTVWYKATG
jgi:hypothetical protein